MTFTRSLVKSLRWLTFLFTVNNNLITGGKHDEGYIHFMYSIETISIIFQDLFLAHIAKIINICCQLASVINHISFSFLIFSKLSLGQIKPNIVGGWSLNDCLSEIYQTNNTEYSNLIHTLHIHARCRVFSRQKALINTNNYFFDATQVNDATFRRHQKAETILSLFLSCVCV